MEFHCRGSVGALLWASVGLAVLAGCSGSSDDPKEGSPGSGGDPSTGGTMMGSGGVTGTGGSAGGSGGTMGGAGGMVGGAGGAIIGPPGSCDSEAGSEWAAWPMPHPEETGLAPPADYESEDDVVLDRVTGLTWLRESSNCDDPVDRCTWNEAVSHCEELSLAGIDEWRLPTIIELVSLVDFTRMSPALDTEAFPGESNRSFWSASQPAHDLTRAWRLLNDGRLQHNPVGSVGSIYALCVSSTETEPPAETEAPASHYTLTAVTVTDECTGLVWQRQPFISELLWEAARDYCETLGLAGGGWRLPSMKELQTLLDRSREEGPLIDTTAFPDTPANAFWSSSESAIGASGVFDRWAVNFETGVAAPVTATWPDPEPQLNNELPVRCVR